MAITYGATRADWDHLSFILGLTDDLLPVVSDPGANISSQSTMKAVGKTPSQFNGRGDAVGIAGWTQKVTNQSEIDAWMADDRLGICLQTRNVRAFDIDVEDPVLAGNVAEFITASVGALPCRSRPNSGKRLFLFFLPGELPKRVIKFDGGMVEMLGTGQQCIVAGQHTSGVRYEWKEGLPSSIPEVTLEQLDTLWHRLAEEFDGVTSQTAASTRANVLHAAVAGDPVAQHLINHRWVKQQAKDGSLHLTCPFEGGHSGPSSISATTYFPAHTGGYDQGNFKCLHASCSGRTQDEFLEAVGIEVPNLIEGLYALPEEDIRDSRIENEQPSAKSLEVPQKKDGPRFEVIPAGKFASGAHPGWIVKNVLPKAGLAVVFGESGSGKSFWALDICAAIARGETWRGHRVHKGKVAYVCAEGAGGMRSRLLAYASHREADLNTLDIGIIPDAPNLMVVQDITDLKASISRFGDWKEYVNEQGEKKKEFIHGSVPVIVMDTFTQVMPGANENAGEDVGKALAHCRAMHSSLGALVILIHHSGKDSSKGARGWSGLRAAADAEIEITRDKDDRGATVTKMKDGADGAEFGFKLETVKVGEDDDGDEITSCIVKDGPMPKKKKKGGSEGEKVNHEKLVYEAMDGLEQVGDSRVQYTDLLAVVKNRLPPPPEGKKVDPRDREVSKAVRLMQEKGKLVMAKGFVRRAGAEDTS